MAPVVRSHSSGPSGLHRTVEILLDGKRWLLKVSRKAKTIFWLSIVEGSFRTTFYFTDKAEQAISKSSLSDELKRQFRNGKRYGKLCGLTILCRNRRDVEYAKQLVAIKTSLI